MTVFGFWPFLNRISKIGLHSYVRTTVDINSTIRSYKYLHENAYVCICSPSTLYQRVHGKYALRSYDPHYVLDTGTWQCLPAACGRYIPRNRAGVATKESSNISYLVLLMLISATRYPSYAYTAASSSLPPVIMQIFRPPFAIHTKRRTVQGPLGVLASCFFFIQSSLLRYSY